MELPRKSPVYRWLRAGIWTIGTIAVLMASGWLWLEYKNLRRTEFQVNLKNAGVRIHSMPVPPQWMMPFFPILPRAFIEVFASDEYDADFGGNTITAEVIRKTLSLPNLTSLHLRHLPSLDDETVAAIAKVGTLRSLDISGTKISDSALSLIAEMTHLEQLKVERTPLSEAGLGVLLKMNRLKELILGDNKIDLVSELFFEASGPASSKTIHVGDTLTFSGTFQSKVAPIRVQLNCYQFSANHSFSFAAMGAITQLENGTFQFKLKAPTKIEHSGFHMIQLIFSTAGSRRIIFTNTVDGFNVAGESQSPQSKSTPLVPSPIQGKVDLKDTPNPNP